MACSAGFGIDGVDLHPGDHVCGLFFGWLDRDTLMVPFFRTGLRAGDRCVVVVDRADPTPVLRQLGTEDEIEQWMASGQLVLQAADEHPENDPPGLDHGEMLAMWQQATVDRADPAGSRFQRIGGEVSWWAPVAPPAEIARYEAEIDRRIGDDMAVLCLYDLSRFSPEAIADAVMTHRVVLVGDRLVDNPWYVAPDDPRASEGVDSLDAPPRPTVHDISDLVTGSQPPGSQWR